MSLTQAKPWSQVDDDAEKPVSAPLLSFQESEYPPDIIRSAPMPEAAPPQSLWQSWLRQLTPIWTFVPLATAAGWTFWGAIHLASPGQSATTRAFWGIGVLTCMTGCLLGASLWMRRHALQHMCGRLIGPRAPSESSEEIRCLGKDAASAYAALLSHRLEMESRLSRMAEQQRALVMERTLADMQKRHTEAIIDSISDAVLVTDAFDQLVLANPAAEEIFQFKRTEAYRNPVSQVIRHEELLGVIQKVRESIGRPTKRRLEINIAERTYALTISQVTGQLPQGADPDMASTDGGVARYGVVAVLRDVTKDREVARLKTEFVSQVSHELRTPLASIRAYVEMLVDGEANDEATQSEYYSIIQTSADRLSRLIDNMLNISRIESGTVRVNKEPVPLSMVVKEAVDTMRPPAEEKKINLTDALTPVVFHVEGDRDLIYQAVLNLVSNAVKYTPEGGTVHVSMKPDERTRTIMVDVTDSGVGIPPEDLPHMFEKFYRVEANKKMAKGTGLGLNLVKQIVETIHGGRMTLRSEVGKGSTFGMVLPLLGDGQKA